MKQLDKRAEAQEKLAQCAITIPAEELSRGIKHVGHSQMSEIANKAIATGSVVAAKQRPMIIKTKTTSNLANLLRGEKDKMAAPIATASSMGNAKSLPGLSWHRPTMQEAQAERIREQRVLAKALTYRRASEPGNGLGCSMGF